MRHLPFMLALILPTFSSGQKTSWTTYFPVESEVIGKIFSGNNPNDSRIAYNEGDVKYNSTSSASSFSREQKKTSTFNLNTLVSSNGLRVSTIDAYGVKVDRINKDGLTVVAPNVPFVYAGLRADSVHIVFRKSKSRTLSPNAIIDSLKKFYPLLTQKSEIGKFIDFLKFTAQSQDSSDYTMTIKDSNVYFMIQVAEIKIQDKTRRVNWEKKCASFLGNDNRYTKEIVLENLDGNPKSHTSGNSNVHFASGKKGAKATLWLEISEDNKNLLLLFRKNDRAKEDTMALKIRNNGYYYNKKPIFRYIYGQDGDVIYSKEVLLTLEANRANNKIIVKSGATKDICGSTYINYPESSLEWREFRQR